MVLHFALIAALILAVPAVNLFAQPGYMRSGAGTQQDARPQKKQAIPDEESAGEPAGDEEEAPVPKKRRRGAKGKEDPMGNDKKAIEAYLQARLAQLQRSYKSQSAFGKKQAAAWESHWARVYEERKVFEVRMARQRLNLFESLASLEPGSHSQTIADFERLQGNVLKAFEDSQRQKMADFFGRVMGDLKEFSAGQEQSRGEFMAEAQAAWHSQKTGSKE